MCKRSKTVAKQFQHMVEQLVITHDNFSSRGVITSSKQSDLLALPTITVSKNSWYNVDNIIDSLLQDIYAIEPNANSKLVIKIFSLKFKVETSATNYFYPWKQQ
jgi:hypothetical protein